MNLEDNLQIMTPIIKRTHLITGYHNNKVADQARNTKSPAMNLYQMQPKTS